MARPQLSRRRGRGRVRASQARPLLEILEDRSLPSNGQWLTVFDGISPAETLEEQSQHGADLLLSSGVTGQEVRVVSAFDLSGSFLVQTAADVSREALARIQKHTGAPYFTLLRYKSMHPQTRSEALAQQLGTRLGRPYTAAGIRQILLRARHKLADCLVQQVARSLLACTPDEVESELLELDLFA